MCINLRKENLISDGEQFHQFKKADQSTLTWSSVGSFLKYNSRHVTFLTPNAMKTLQMRWKHYKCGENITNAMKTLQMRWKHYKCDENITNEMKTLQMWWKHYKWDVNITNVIKILHMWWKHYKCDENISVICSIISFLSSSF